MSTRGVIYYNTGTSCAVRLLVSLASLRRHYQGPVTILTEGEVSDTLCAQIGEALNANVVPWNCGVTAGKNRAYLAKTRYHEGTPYDTTIALDSDTLVVGAVDDLFNLAEEASFCVAQLAAWRSDGKIIGGRLRQWQAHLPDHVEAALRFGPAINCGVVAFKKNAPIFADWHRYAVLGREFFIPDEVCCQLILHRYPHRILNGKWNRSCKHDDPDLPDTRVIHFHGRKHCRAGLPYHGGKWMSAYDELVQNNLADIASWTPAGDRLLSRHLKACRKDENVVVPASTLLPHMQRPVYETDLWCRRGHFNTDQADKCIEICERKQPKYVLEIGFCTGRSAACVLHNTASSLLRMISIDINLDYKAPHGRRMAMLLKSRFPQWDVIEKSSRDVLTPEFFQREFPHGIDLAMIDGDHSYEGCLFDIEAISHFMNLNGIMVVDDYRSGRPNGTRIDSVTRSVEDFLTRHAGVFIGEQWHNNGKGFCILTREPGKFAAESGTSTQPPESRKQDTFAIPRPYTRKMAQDVISNTAILRIVLGARKTSYNGWISTDKNVLDVTRAEDWTFLFADRKIHRLLAEHVWEHLTAEETAIANQLALDFLEPGGCLRIAVPDGNHPDADYIEQVRPGGCGRSAKDHRQLLTHLTLGEALTTAGFEIEAMEYWDCHGVFHHKPWLSMDGHIKRSALNDKRNRGGRLAYTSLIMDAYKQ